MTWLTLLNGPYVNLENVVATMQALTVPALEQRRLRKRYITEKKTSLSFGIDFRRISDYEPPHLQTRGTLGGFTPLADLGGTDSDGCSLEKDKAREKECILTALTKKIGLGIYRHSRTPSPSRMTEEKEDVDWDERETWYMLYPPPPSPSLARESVDWDSTSSSVHSAPQSVSTRDSPMEMEIDGEAHREGTSTRESLYASGSLTPDAMATTDMQGIDQDVLDASVENLAQQYRDILPSSPDPGCSSRQEPAPQAQAIVLIETPSPVATPPPPKTIRKVKAQQSLRDIVDMGSQCPISSLWFPPFSPLEEINSPIETIITSSKDTSKRKRLSHRRYAPSPPPRESSLSFIPNSSYCYSPGHGPRRTHGRREAKRSPAQPPSALNEFEFHFTMDATERSNKTFPSPPFYQYQPATNSPNDLYELFPRPLTIRRPGMGMKNPSPPPDPIRWEIPPVPPVPTIIVSGPAERAMAMETEISPASSMATAVATTDPTWSSNRERPRVPLRGGVRGVDGVMNPFDMMRLRDVEGGWF